MGPEYSKVVKKCLMCLERGLEDVANFGSNLTKKGVEYRDAMLLPPRLIKF